MAGRILIVMELAVHDGRLEEFKPLARKMVEMTQAGEPGVLGYNAYFSPDERTFISVEFYASSEVLMSHSMAIMPLMKKAMEMTSITHFSVFGDVAAEMRPQLESMGAKLYELFEGFTRV